LQNYTGTYVAPSNGENPIERVASFLEGLRVDTYVAVFLENCEEEPVIGVIKEVTDDHFKKRDLQREVVSFEPAKNKTTLDRYATQGVHHSAFI